MKKLLLVCLLIGLGREATIGQDCPPDDLIIQYQSQIDWFTANYPNCTEFPGNLVIYFWVAANL